MKSLLKIAVAEPSLIIRSGILSVLRRLSSLNIEMIEITDVAQLSSTLSWRKPDMLIINPLIPGSHLSATDKEGVRRPEMYRVAVYAGRCLYAERV